MKEVKRVGLAVWVKNTKTARNLRRFGNVHYISRRLKYVTIYVDAEKVDQIIRNIQQLNFVTKVERSFRHLIPTEYDNVRPDKAKEYDYKMDKVLISSQINQKTKEIKLNEASM